MLVTSEVACCMELRHCLWTWHDWEYQSTCTSLVTFFAGEGGKRSKKWRKILEFPHISVCLPLKEDLGKNRLNGNIW